MTLSVTGDNIQFPDLSTQASAQVGFKNRVIDGGFTLNQRVYVSGTALSAGVYAHDRWKAGASGCTYTFTQGALGVNTTITITAGSLIQVIEGCNVAEGGTYVLSWTGTAQGKANTGSYGASGTVVVTGWTPGTNLPIEFNTGTVSNIQLEKGSTATSFDYRDYGRELIMCQRYYLRFNAEQSASIVAPLGLGSGTSDVQVPFIFTTPMRTVPTPAQNSLNIADGVTSTAVTSVSLQSTQSSTAAANVDFSVASGVITFRPYLIRAASTAGYLSFSSEL